MSDRQKQQSTSKVAATKAGRRSASSGVEDAATEVEAAEGAAAEAEAAEPPAKPVARVLEEYKGHWRPGMHILHILHITHIYHI
jgi:hypothetical protein